MEEALHFTEELFSLAILYYLWFYQIHKNHNLPRSIMTSKIIMD